MIANAAHKLKFLAGILWKQEVEISHHHVAQSVEHPLKGSSRRSNSAVCSIPRGSIRWLEKFV